MGRRLTRKGIVKKLDKLVSQIVIARDGNKCVQCGSTEQLTCGHLFSRGNYATRWDVKWGENTFCQCWNCNFRHTYDSFSFNNWFIINFGRDKWEELHARSSQLTHYKDVDLLDMFDKLKGLQKDFE